MKVNPPAKGGRFVGVKVKERKVKSESESPAKGGRLVGVDGETVRPDLHLFVSQRGRVQHNLRIVKMMMMMLLIVMILLFVYDSINNNLKMVVMMVVLIMLYDSINIQQ